MSKLIYIAEDEANIRNPIQSFLEKEGYTVMAFENGDALFTEFSTQPCDLAILDVMMPGSSGFVICAKLRAISNVPIIMLTARDTDDDYVSGISLGSDDYLTKPFSPVKLVVKIKALFRRLEMKAAIQDTQPTKKVEYADLTIDPNNLATYCKGVELRITNTEMKFLVHLIDNKERAVSREELLLKIWEHDASIETRVTDDTVKRLRRKLLDASSDTMIETIWGFGFRIKTRGTSKS
jgi:DNA-binding response OmpR family regulator